MASLWIIDGYNFIRQSRRFSELEASNPSAGKKQALQWLGQFSSLTGAQVCVVFDAYSGLHREPLRENLFGLQILNSRGAYTADEEIAELAKEKGEGCIVVSSDREVLAAAIRAKASVLTSQEFEREVAKIFSSEKSEARGLGRKNRGDAFRPVKEKKKAYLILRKYQR